LKKFSFKLEPVLNVRKCKEEELQRKLAEILDRLQDAVEEMAKTLSQRHLIANQLEEFKKKPIGIEDLLTYQNYIESLDKRLDEQETRIQKIEKEVEEMRELLLKACKDKKIIEKIKERQKACYNNELLRQEIIFLDEVGVIRSARKKLENDSKR
jgi:flagellar protein FliJ